MTWVCPRYGTWVSGAPVVVLNSSPIRCPAVPTPGEPNVSLPGFALACAISSATVLGPASGTISALQVV